MPQLSLKNWHNILPVLVQIGIEMALAAIRSTVESRRRFKLAVRRGDWIGSGVRKEEGG